MIMDIQAVVNNKSGMPMRIVNVGGKSYNCLCDSGACTTVLTTPPPGFKPSSKVVWVRSASRHVVQNHLSEPLQIVEPETGKTTQMKIIVDDSCPINLLGRDCLSNLEIAIIPVDGKMNWVPLNRTYVSQSIIEPHYYWTLDVEVGDQCRC